MSLRRLALSLLALALAGTSPGWAGESAFACPDLSRATRLGDCPGEAELRAAYDQVCPAVMQKRGECMPFAAFAVDKNKAIWSVTSGGQEFLPYVRCDVAAETVRAARPETVRVACADNGRCEAVCDYGGEVRIRLRFAGACRTETGSPVDCRGKPEACQVLCEQAQ